MGGCWHSNWLWLLASRVVNLVCGFPLRAGSLAVFMKKRALNFCRLPAAPGRLSSQHDLYYMKCMLGGNSTGARLCGYSPPNAGALTVHCQCGSVS